MLVLCLIFNVFFLQNINAQLIDNALSYEKVNLSYSVGGQVYNDSFIYSPGYSFNFSHGFKLNEDVGMGLGVGLVSLTDERFLPLYVEFIGQKKNNRNSPFILFQGGYSIGWNLDSDTDEGYDMGGGFYFNAGLGRKFSISDRYALMFNWSYCHQFASMEYTISTNNNYSEILNYDMILISIGLMFY